MANEYTDLDTLFTDVADAIRSKTESTDEIYAYDFPMAIEGIAVGVDTSDATATSSDVLSGKTAYVDGIKITGEIETKTSNNLTVNGATVTVPAGYYPSQASKSVQTVTQATPTISINSSGLITATATQAAGYVSSGTKSGTTQLTTKAATTITPTTSNQTAVSSSVYTTGAITVKGDANLKAENIVSGVSIFGVAGSATIESDYNTLYVSSVAPTNDIGSDGDFYIVRS